MSSPRRSLPAVGLSKGALPASTFLVGAGVLAYAGVSVILVALLGVMGLMLLLNVWQRGA